MTSNLLMNIAAIFRKKIFTIVHWMKKSIISNNLILSVFLLSLAIISGSLISCKDDSIVNETGVLKCTLNGTIWKSDRQWPQNDTTPATFAQIVSGRLYITALSFKNDTSGVAIRLFKPYANYIGIYKDSLGDNSSIGSTRFYPKYFDNTSRNDINFTTGYKKTWSVHITKYDQVNKLVSGEFEINQTSTVSGSSLSDYILTKGFFNDIKIR